MGEELKGDGRENEKVRVGREKGKEEEKEGGGNRGWEMEKERVRGGEGKGGVCSFARKKRPSFDRKSQT